MFFGRGFVCEPILGGVDEEGRVREGWVLLGKGNVLVWFWGKPVEELIYPSTHIYQAHHSALLSIIQTHTCAHEYFN